MQDVDVLILGNRGSQEEIKRMMTEKNPHFYLVDPKTPGADWKVLWYHPGGKGSIRRPEAIKIDVLFPGIMELPSFNPSWIDYNNDHRLPVAPLSLVLLHKARGWWRRINSPSDRRLQLHKKHARDVANLAPLASQKGVTIKNDVLPHDFVDSASEWVNEFIAAYPEFRTRNHWRKIGFRTYV